MSIVDWILEKPAVYAAWQAPFVSSKFAPAERRLRLTETRRVLDIGCGPGTNANRFAHAEYVGLDINERYLAIETADLSSLGQFDTIRINSLLHHLPDESVTRTLCQVGAALAPGGIVHILELVMPDRFSLATVLARIDRGRYPRSVSAWSDQFARHFEPLCLEPYTVGGGLWAMLYFQGKSR